MSYTYDRDNMLIIDDDGQHVAELCEQATHEQGRLLAAGPDLVDFARDTFEFLLGHPDRTVGWAEQRRKLWSRAAQLVAKLDAPVEGKSG